MDIASDHLTGKRLRTSYKRKEWKMKLRGLQLMNLQHLADKRDIHPDYLDNYLTYEENKEIIAKYGMEYLDNYNGK